MELSGYYPAIYGMRSPLESWDQMDSEFTEDINIGKNDMTLAHKLIRAGEEHRKFDRMINIYLNITAPMFWWKQFDTYKIGSVRNSSSTMHTLNKKEITRIANFSMESVKEPFLSVDEMKTVDDYLAIIERLKNSYNKHYELGKHDPVQKIAAKKYWRAMIEMLPESFNMQAVVMINYETAMKIIKQRKGHKLYEWDDLITFLKELPILKEFYSKDIVYGDADTTKYGLSSAT